MKKIHTRAFLSIISWLAMGAIAPLPLLAADSYTIQTDANTAEISGSEGTEMIGKTINASADMNGDGFMDLLISKDSTFGSNGKGGGVYVMYGTANDYSDATVTSADALLFAPLDVGSPEEVTTGDVNGDGLTDIAFSLYGSDDKVATYLFYGSTTKLTGDISIENADASFYSTNTDARVGRGLSMEGDVDNDGYNDLLIGDDYYQDGAGITYLFYGKSEKFADDIETSTADANWYGEFAEDRIGAKVSTKGDFNGDGFSDLIIGAREQSVLLPDEDNGAAHIYYGSATRFSGSESIEESDNYFTDTILYARAGDQFEVVGDVNNDGFDDITIQRYWDEVTGGSVYLFYGSSEKFEGAILANVSYDTRIAGEAEYDNFGEHIGTSDINADGTPELVVMAPFYDNSTETRQDEGAAYVFDLLSGGKKSMDEITAAQANVILRSSLEFGNFATVANTRNSAATGSTAIITSLPYANGDEAEMGRVFVTQFELPTATDITKLAGNSVRVAFDDATNRTIKCFPTGSGTPKAQLSSNKMFVYCAKASGKEVRVLSAYSGEVLSKKRLYNTNFKAVKFKRTNFFLTTNTDQLYILGRSKNKVNLAYATVKLDSGKARLRTVRTVQEAPLKTDQFDIKVKSSKKKLNVLKNSERIQQYSIKKGKIE